MTGTATQKKPSAPTGARAANKGKPGYCPGCGRKTEVNSGPMSSDNGFFVEGESGKGQLTTFCTYGCWIKHRKRTGQDEFGDGDNA